MQEERFELFKHVRLLLRYRMCLQGPLIINDDAEEEDEVFGVDWILIYVFH